MWYHHQCNHIAVGFSMACLLQAISILNSISDEEVRHKPAVLTTQISLQEQQQELAGALSTAQEGLQWWQNSMTADKSQKTAAQTWLLQQLVHLQLKTGDCSFLSACLQHSAHLQGTEHDTIDFCCLTMASVTADPYAAQNITSDAF